MVNKIRVIKLWGRHITNKHKYTGKRISNSSNESQTRNASQRFTPRAPRFAVRHKLETKLYIPKYARSPR